MDVTKTSEEDPGVDPLEKPLTIAAACNLVLRRNFLEPETIAIIPPQGYGPGQNFSRESIRRLNYEALKDNVIHHAMNGGEVPVQGRVTVDGICFETRKIYSYLGCLFHGCRVCYDEDTINPVSQKPMFALCGTCLKEKRQDYCPHAEDDRVIRGTWVTIEVQKAIEMGYEVRDIEVVWHWEERALYDKDTRTGGLFTNYIDQFLRLKQEASGYPSWCVTSEDKQRYIEDYFKNEGIRLDPPKNPGLRSLAKLCLNSMLGKFAPRSGLSQTEIHDDPAEVNKLLQSDTVTVDNIRLNEEIVEVTYKEDGAFARVNPNTNVVVAAFTTCHARLKLYEVLEKLGDRALYQDTDSVVFQTRLGEWEPPTGDYLGQLTDEVDPKDGNYIATFVTGGCKNYAYKLDTGKAIMKVRGITLNVRNSSLVNPSTLERMVKGLTSDARKEEEDRVTVTDPHKIVRNVKTKNIESRVFKKDYRVVFDKRWIAYGFDTLPYGYGCI